MSGLRNVPSIAPQLQSPVTQLNGDYLPVLNSIDDIHAADFSGGDVTLTLSQAAAGIISCSGATTNRNLIFPHGYTGQRTIDNQSGHTITVKTDASGTTVAIADGSTVDVVINGNDVSAKSGVSSITVTAPVTDTGTSTVPNIGIDAATSGAAGSMSAADKAKLDAATNTNTPNTLAMRDAAERLQIADPSASQDASTKGYTDTADNLRLKRDGTQAMTGALDMGSHLISNLLDPVSAQDAATRAWVLAQLVGLLELAGNIDASSNPNYPAASKGDSYYVTVAGKVGGGSGKPVDVGDVVIAKADNAGGTDASVGASWFIIEHNLVGALLAGNNLSDLSNTATARTNLGVAIDVDVQSYSAKTAAIAALTWAADKIAYFTSVSAVATTDLTAAARSFLASASDAAMRSYLGLVIGTNVQAWSSALDAWALKARPTGAVVGDSDAQTLTSKRVQPRVNSQASTSTLTPEKDTYDIFRLTAQAAALTIANHSTSTMADGEQIKISILDNGTARAISFGTEYVARGGIALPTTTTISKRMEMLFEWDASLSKFVLLALAQES